MNMGERYKSQFVEVKQLNTSYSVANSRNSKSKSIYCFFFAQI
ncbi:hypothetical protein FUSO4_06780 [Fusobacterium necrophorum DJ-1]|uniref:Uncharacterized protein n=2 Tax=Fusobacterium necrophorum TaxID=859 RepID=A0AAN4AT51_9FUSO|nr:hypothetical protein HMPREF1127_2052 [Fusobacterium necrophorum subsp. funduliforme Fnf 1007]KDE65043.1 hypothetical protein FUSO4_06780 [Fusobacterium necrophorum DJ-1]KDE65832.1 hypothetical protein FUSO5_04005 [Fusobacterium necrophorum BFTR-1]KDE69460.1 hypothetical protein FUSO6_06695 [Fusobacterium necrophorum DAB]KDE72147.1 hypothetical protein FUSO8_06400 [Fusobacterium necrophorum DJ-2]